MLSVERCAPLLAAQRDPATLVVARSPGHQRPTNARKSYQKREFLDFEVCLTIFQRCTEILLRCLEAKQRCLISLQHCIEASFTCFATKQRCFVSVI